MKGEVLVKARPRIQYDMSGKPSMYFEQERGGARGAPSKRERLAGLAGGLVGVLGGLTGKHRSLGGLLGGMYAGGAQGAGLMGGIAGKTVGRGRRAELALEEQSRAKQGRKEGVERMRRRVERAEEAQDRINAPAGANTQGVVSQLRDKVRVRRTPQSMRRDFRLAQAAEAEREAEAQAARERREVRREDLARARALRDFTPRQLEEMGGIDDSYLEHIRNLREALRAAGHPLVEVPSSPPPPAANTAAPIPPPQGGVLAEAQRDANIDPQHTDHDSEGLNQLGQEPQSPAGLGTDLAQQQSNNASSQLTPEQIAALIREGMLRQGGSQ